MTKEEVVSCKRAVPVCYYSQSICIGRAGKFVTHKRKSSAESCFLSYLLFTFIFFHLFSYFEEKNKEKINWNKQTLNT